MHLAKAALLFLIGVAVSGSALAQGLPQGFMRDVRELVQSVQRDPVRKKQLIEKGGKVAGACVGCHGEDGRSPSPEIPSLAGQHPVYILVQFRKFMIGTRPHELMLAFINSLTDDERLQLAMFFGSQKAVPADVPSNPKSALMGAGIFHEGFCVECHGRSAYGADVIPRLAGQPRDYLQRSLMLYRARTGERRDMMMALVMSRLTDVDIEHLAEYLSRLE